MEINWTIVLSAISLEVVLISTAVGVVWKLSRSEISIRADADTKIAEAKAEADRKNAAVQAEADRKHAEAIKTVAALSEKVYQVEIWSRDEFVRKGSFELVIARLERTMELMGAKIEAAVDKMATKFDALQQSQHHRD